MPSTSRSGDRAEEVFVAERPWGRFQQFVANEPVTVKIITIEPGHRLSLQRHGNRAEMWQVLDVPIDVEVDDRRWVAQPGERVWVPANAVHRIGNPGPTAGRLLEIAFGDFDEADIERLHDDYARPDVLGAAAARPTPPEAPTQAGVGRDRLDGGSATRRGSAGRP